MFGSLYTNDFVSVSKLSKEYFRFSSNVSPLFAFIDTFASLASYPSN
jgi:hypothetical protein